MSTAVFIEPIPRVSPLSKARIAGVFYLLTIVTGIAAFIIRDRFIVSGDAPATAANILAQPSLFQLAFASDLLCAACYVAVTALFYELFKPVSRLLSRTAAYFSLVGCGLW